MTDCTRHRAHLHLPLPLLLCVFAMPAAQAQISTDGTLGAPSRTLTGPAYTIPQSLGRLSGANLFHSFQTFNIATQESATFTTTSPGIANVISRVTGGSPSQINGLLSLDAAAGAPAFYFINPAGVTFGAGAAIDVPGALHVSTADALVFADGRLHADAAKSSTFSSAPPLAFGFLGTGRATLAVRDQALLAMKPGQALTLSAGDILIDGAQILTAGGSVRLAAVGREAVDVGRSGALPALAGDITLDQGGSIYSVALGPQPADPIELAAGSVALRNAASLVSDVFAGGGDGGVGGAAIQLTVADRLSLTGGANIASFSSFDGDAGAIRLRAGRVDLGADAYLYSAADGVGGGSGEIDVAATGALRLTDGASISSSTSSRGASGAIRLQAGSLALASGATIASDSFGAAASSDIRIDVPGLLALSDQSSIDTRARATGDAGAIQASAGSLSLASGSRIGSLVTGAADGPSARAGAVELRVAGDAQLGSGAALSSATVSAGAGGDIRLWAHDLVLDAASIGSVSASLPGRLDDDGGAAGQISLQLTGRLSMHNGSLLDTSTLTRGAAGAVQVQAQAIDLDGGSRISSSALDGSGPAGTIDLLASAAFEMHGDSSVTTGTSTAGNAGAIRLTAGAVWLDGGSSIGSSAGIGSRGAGGAVVVQTPGALVMREGANIVALGAEQGPAGSVDITAASVALDGLANIVSAALGSGDGGRVAITSSGDVTLRDGAFLNTNAGGPGRAGTIALDAQNLTIDDGAGISSRGDSGRIELHTRGDVSILNSTGAVNRSGVVSTSAFAAGNGGAVEIQAANLLLDAPGGGVFSFALDGSGNAGRIDVKASGDVTILQGGLSSSTASAGAAGSVQVQAARVQIDGALSGISAAALAGSSGQTGSVSVLADEHIHLSGGAFISIDNQARLTEPGAVVPTVLRLQSPEIDLQQALITASSSGNVAASRITIDAGERLGLERSAVSTAANDGDGGAITILGDAALWLRQSAITTSVFGALGDGGDIRIAGHTLVLDSAFIQANTAADQARGGLVRIDVGALVASGSSLFLAGDTVYGIAPEVFGFNVIQAAAPTGVSGVVELTSPVLDPAASLQDLRADFIDGGGLGRSLCQASDGSALALVGRGGLVPSPGALLRAGRVAERRAGQLPATPLPVVASAFDLWGCR